MSIFYNPRIITNGLVLCLDAANTQSYPGTGNTWTDLSTRKNNGTLINGPTFNGANGGGIIFNATNHYIQFTSTSVQTICFWGKMDSDIPSFAGLVCTGANEDGGLRTRFGTFRAVAPQAPDANDFQAGYVSSFMINGVSNLSTDANGVFIVPNGRSLQQDFYVGTIGDARNLSTISHIFNARAYKGTIYAVFLYDRKLSNDELLQNFNAYRGRYGL